MVLTSETQEQIIEFVKLQPRSIQEVAKHIGRSWVTAERYVDQINKQSGLLAVKIFREGTRGALKLVYYVQGEVTSDDELEKALYKNIRRARFKHHHDFLDIYQHIPDDGKNAFLEHYQKPNISVNQNLSDIFRRAKHSVYIFSGNLSFFGIVENDTPIVDVIEELLQRKVRVYILTRIDVGTLTNFELMKHLLQKYPKQIEIRHSFNPLRGYIIDDAYARFKDEEQLYAYREGELPANTRIFYEVTDNKWVAWLQRVFWNLWRISLDYKKRLAEIEKIF